MVAKCNIELCGKALAESSRRPIMIAGIVLIIAGILIAVYPPLLSIIVAILLILLGSILVSIAYFNRKYSKHFDNPVIELFFRF